MRYVRTLLALSLLSLLTFPLLAASRFGDYAGLMADVPFDFVVGNKVFPAGQCIIQPGSSTFDTLLVRNLDAKVNQFAAASRLETRNAAGTSALIFHKYGDRYFLSAIRVEGMNIQFKVPESKAENELRARQAPSTEQVVPSL